MQASWYALFVRDEGTPASHMLSHELSGESFWLQQRRLDPSHRMVDQHTVAAAVRVNQAPRSQSD